MQLIDLIKGLVTVELGLTTLRNIWWTFISSSYQLNQPMLEVFHQIAEKWEVAERWRKRWCIVQETEDKINNNVNALKNGKW